MRGQPSDREARAGAVAFGNGGDQPTSIKTRASFQGKADLIARALDVPLSQVTGDELPAQTHHGARALSPREAALLKGYQRLSEADRDAVERIVSRMADHS